MRLRGFSLMTNILEDHVKDHEMITLVCQFSAELFTQGIEFSSIPQALECLTTWPLLQRNKVDDSKIVIPVEACALSENEHIKGLAQKVGELRIWSSHTILISFYTTTASGSLGYFGIWISNTEAS